MNMPVFTLCLMNTKSCQDGCCGGGGDGEDFKNQEDQQKLIPAAAENSDSTSLDTKGGCENTSSQNSE